MKNPLLRSLQPFPRILFAILLIISCFLLFLLIAMLLAVPVFGVSLAGIMTLLTDYNNPVAVPLLKYFQIFQEAGIFIVPPLLAAILFSGRPFHFLGLQHPSGWSVWGLGAIVMVVSVPLIDQVIRLNEAMQLPVWMAGVERWMKDTETEAQNLTEAFLDVDTAGGFLFNLLMIAVLPAIGEELLFRGLLQRLFRDWLKNIHIAIILAGLLFGAMHLQFYGFIPRTILGVLFGYLFYWSGSLWIPIFTHFLNNAAAVTVSFLHRGGVISSSPDEFGQTDSLFLVILSLAATALALCLFRYTAMKNRPDAL